MTMDAGERLALTSVAVNIFLTGLKYFLGVFSGSLALLADAVHSTADLVSSAAIWAGLRISRRKTRRFPYGLYKVENLVALIVAGLILLAGYKVLMSVFETEEKIQVERLPYAIAGVSLILVIVYLFSRYELKEAKALNSPSLTADARQFTADWFSYGLLLLSLTGSYFGVQAYVGLTIPLDKIAALLIVVLIAWMGLRIAGDGIRVLLDASVDYPTLNTIRDLILLTPQVSKVNSLMGRSSGRFKFIEADLTLKVRDLEKAHFVANQIENRIKAQIPHVDQVLVHYAPLQKATQVIAMPVTEDRAQLSEHFGEAPYFLVLTLGTRDNRLLEEKFLANPHRSVKTGKGIQVSEWLVSQGVDEVIAAKSFEHKGPHYVFADAGVAMQHTDIKDIAQIKAGLLAPAEEKKPQPRLN
ncbi:MAG: cation diffusion facilitator family transporter [Desulfobaccales bacterium]